VFVVTYREIAAQVAAAAPLTPRLTELRADDAGSRWAAGFDDGLVVVIEHVPARGVLGLSADLGYPPEEHIDTVQETLLVYNSLRQQIDGASMALAEPAGELLHLADLDLRDVTPERLAKSLGEFAALSSAWRKVVADGARIDDELARAAARTLSTLTNH
jgi:hypothetical protein